MRAHLIRAFLLLLSAGVLAACRTASSDGPAAGAAGPAGSPPPPASSATSAASATSHPYVGMWVTADNQIRQELLPNGRYDEARGDRESAYTGRYEVSGDQIDYWDDTGFTADGRFEGDVLHHGGYLFYREGSEAHRRATDQEEEQ